MDLSFTPSSASELSAAFLQATITIGLAVLFAVLYTRYRKAYFAYWTLAWLLYALRVSAIISFLGTADRIWLFWHQVTTGWTALGLLWATLVFSQQLPWRWPYALVALFPPVWSFIAIYRLDNFMLAAGPAVLFLSGATLWTGWAFFRHHRLVGSRVAALLAAAFFLWGLHHLDYPFLRARGAWNPWGYYLDLILELAVGAGVLLLVQEDLRRGLSTLSALSGDLQRAGRGEDVTEALVRRPLTLPAVRGSAIFMVENGTGCFIRGAGVCSDWVGRPPTGPAADAVRRVLQSHRPEVLRGREGHALGEIPHEYVAAMPVLREDVVTGALVFVGEARDPFAALDTPFLIALGQQVGAAMENADLNRRLKARTQDLERLATRMVQQHEHERRRLFRELHDETAQAFAAVNLHLGMLLESAPAELVPRLERAQALVGEGIQSIRNVTEDLRPSLLDDLGLLPALRALTRDFGERTGLEVQLEAPESLPDLSDEAELALFRALQEALANVARHAGASRVEVQLQAGNGRAFLVVEDDGRGLRLGQGDVQENGSAGLVGMRERITALGGTVRMEGRSGDGARLEVRVPIPEEA
jgi:signal transduction histidine kinase